METELTQKQQDIYNFIKAQIREKNFPPSVREICKAVGINSTSSVHTQLEILEKKNYIRRSPNKTRTIEILEEDFYNTKVEREFVNVPIIGKVTAGEPILAIENIEDYFPIPVDYVHNDDVFMLTVSGDSMSGVGIYDKDLVLVRKQSSAINGDVVVALLEDHATIKTYQKEKDMIVLKPQNPAYDPIITPDVSILGKVVGLFRKF